MNKSIPANTQYRLQSSVFYSILIKSVQNKVEHRRRVVDNNFYSKALQKFIFKLQLFLYEVKLMYSHY